MMNATANELWRGNFRQVPQPRLRLFCFPYAGGSAAIFHKWAASLPQNIEVCPIYLPGRGHRSKEKAFTDIDSLVESTAESILPSLAEPFAFFGHSMGALICFELARYLRRGNHPQPLHIFVSGRSAPQIQTYERITYNLPDDEFISELRRLDGTPHEILEHAELLALMLPILRADFALTQRYEYKDEPPLDCSISALGGLEDYEVTKTQLESWREQTSSRFTLHLFAGNHFFVNTARSFLLPVISQELLELIKPSTGSV